MPRLPRPALWLIPLSLAAQPGAAQDASILFDLLCGRTVHYYDPGIPTGTGIGNQIEYTSPDGSAFLWHPDDDDVIIGTWSVEPDTEGNGMVCYEYPEDSFDQALIPYNGEPICFDGMGLTNDIVDLGIRNGDVYGLSDGIPPFEMQSHPQLGIEDLRGQFPQDAPATGCVAMMS
ncbi:MAG: hypothetical protein AAFN09_03805 [Pseudomonadota bacterium]